MRNTDSFYLLSTLCIALACSGGQEFSGLDGTGGAFAVGGQASGGQSATGGAGATTTGQTTGGSTGTGGSFANTGGVATGGVTTGGMATGGAATGGFSTGGFSTGGFSTGGVSTGGMADGGQSAGGASTGGEAAGGVSTGGMADGGESAGGASTGGEAAGGASSGGSSTGGTSTGGTTGGCQTGQIAASEVVIMGESFYAMAPQYIQQRIQENARNAGALGNGESYRNVAISGQPMSVVAGEYDTALQGGTVKIVIMDGGGIDCMSSSCDSCPGQFETLLAKMASNDVEDVIYTRYPEPGNPPGSNATLKNNLDILMPRMEEVCANTTAPRCHWVDLRPVWVNGDTNDGLHPTQSGGEHCGDAIWEKMVDECIAQ